MSTAGAQEAYDLVFSTYCSDGGESADGIFADGFESGDLSAW